VEPLRHLNGLAQFLRGVIDGEAHGGALDAPQFFADDVGLRERSIECDVELDLARVESAVEDPTLQVVVGV
jgi:hypothetical protein